MSAEPVTATRTYLEMTDRGALRRGRQPDADVQISRRDSCEPAFWRYLYTTVGAGYRWLDRLSWTDDDIRRYLDDPAVSLWVMTIGGEIAGYYEIRCDPPSAEHGRENDSVEIVYFGLMPAFTGRGLGAFMLTDAVDRAWSLGARRVWLHTCTFDHPQAIPNYIARGFRVFRVEEYAVPKVLNP
jgi:GNAT superfamily N-acetyltransferase